MKNLLINRLTVNGYKVSRDIRKYIDGVVCHLDFITKDGRKISFYKDGHYFGILSESNETDEQIEFDESVFMVDGKWVDLFSLFTASDIKRDLLTTSDFKSEDRLDSDRESYRDWDSK
jgi:hypothetical protein